MEVLFIKLGRPNLDLGHLGQVVLVVDAITQHITKIPQRPLQCVRSPFLLSLLEGSGLALAVLHMAIPDIFVVGAISQRDPHDDGQAKRDLECLGVLVDEVYLYILDAGRPPVETENFVRKGDDLLGGDIVDLLARWATAGGQVLWPELLLQSGLEGSDLGSSKFRYVRLSFLERVGDAAVLITWAVDSRG